MEATDLDSFLAMLVGAGIEHTVDRSIGFGPKVILEAKSEGVAGYLGFTAEFDFDLQERLVKVGIWE